MWSHRAKPKCVGIGFDKNVLEAGCFQARAESLWIDRRERIEDMDQSHAEAHQAVSSGKDAARDEHSSNFAQEFVLKSRRSHVVEHREGDRAGKLRVIKTHGRCVAADYFNVRAAQSRAQRVRQLGINFKRRKVRNFCSQQVRGQPRAWPDFEHPFTQIRAIQHPGKNELLEDVVPPPGAAQIPVNEVQGRTSPFAVSNRPAALCHALKPQAMLGGCIGV